MLPKARKQTMHLQLPGGVLPGVHGGENPISESSIKLEASGYYYYPKHSLANCCSLSAIRKSWEVEHKVWAISEDGELSVEYPTPDGGMSVQ